MQINTTRTVYGHAVQMSTYMGVQWIPKVSTTLNELLGIQETATVAPTDRHALSFYVIGNKGSTFTIGADGIALPQAYIHSPTDAAPYNIVPMVVRDVNDDLSAAERAKYCLRKIEPVPANSGVDHIVYYGRRFKPEDVIVKMLQRTKLDNDVVNDVEFVPSGNNLRPTPVLLDDPDSDDKVIKTTRSSINASAVLPMTFDANDVAEFKNAMFKMYGSDKYSTITELAMVSGIDKTINVTSTGSSTVEFVESVMTQVTSFTPCAYNLQYQNGGFTFGSDIGIGEPLFELDTSN